MTSKPSDLDELLSLAVKNLPHPTQRSGQNEMAHAVARACEEREHLLVQAGTGTGKSLAYLVAALHARQRAVIATATLALQAQLVHNDLPYIAEALTPALGYTPTFALLKGRQNYVCHAKLDTAEADTLFDELATETDGWVGETSALARNVKEVRHWAQHSDTGDRADLDIQVSDTAWRTLSTSARECVGAHRCPFGAECFAERAREKARDVDIVVTNHTLLALDVASDTPILPEHECLIVDEAHEFTQHATTAATAEINPDAVARLGKNRELSTTAREALSDAAQTLRKTLDRASGGRVRSLPAELRDALSTLGTAARTAHTGLAHTAGGDGGEALAARAVKQSVEEIIETTSRIQGNTGEDVVWISADSQTPRVRTAPLSVAPLLREKLYTDRSVVFTSATLTPGGYFENTAKALGLPRSSTQELPWLGTDVGSPFTYQSQGVLYVAAHLPKPQMSGLPDTTADELLSLVNAARGRTLGLFSSRNAASAAAEVLREHTDIRVLLQGEDSLSTLVREFRDDTHSCLFGVLSLWQGVDVPGEACQLVVIDRIPFPRPDDPLMSARSEAADREGRNGFMSVSVPHAAVRLAQGAGRLIRRSDDKGVVAVLDSRLHNARYAPYIRNTLPAFWYTTSRNTVLGALTRLSAEDA